MKIAILSDIHDNVWNLQATLRALDNTDALLCLGDLNSPFIIPMLAKGYPERPIHIVFGNNDGDLFRITQNASAFANITLHGEFFRGELGDKRISASHFPNVAAELQTETTDLLCYGHNHLYWVERQGSCLVVNPGPIMGFDPGSGQDVPASFVIYDSEQHDVESFVVQPATAEDIAASTMGLVVKPYEQAVQ
ncbi:MAG: metallophosphatase family protein [Spirochaeta sp.]|nr:metallophosphatase family protein [Spirochaeta sp.]